MQDSRFNNSFKFTVAYRLLRVDGFEHVLRAESAISIADKHFKIFFVRNGKNNARLGIIASKKAFPSSVDRNRLKRIIRERFRQHNVKRCKTDMVVMARHEFPLKIDAQIENLERLFSQVESRCAES